MDIQSNLSFKNHISRVTKKANSMLGFLRRNLREANEETKTEAYFTMVRFNLDMCTVVLSGLHTNGIRYTRSKWYNEESHGLSQTGRGTPAASQTCLTIPAGTRHETRRSKLQLTVLFRIVHGLIEIPSTGYLTSATSRTRSEHSLTFQQHLQTATSSASSPRTMPLCFIAIDAFVSNAL